MRETIRVEPLSSLTARRGVNISPAVRAGGFVFVSGFPPFDPETGEIRPMPIELQTRLVMEQMKACLEGRRLLPPRGRQMPSLLHLGRTLRRRECSLQSLLPDRSACPHLHPGPAFPRPIRRGDRLRRHPGGGVTGRTPFADVSPVEVAAAATLLSDVARATMVSMLMDGRARTAGELAQAAGVTPQTASSHLAKLIEGGLVSAHPQGRHRYHRLASPDAAHAVEALSLLAASPARRPRPVGPKDPLLRQGRTCYDHFAGRLGVAITDALRERAALTEEGATFRLTETGESQFARLGVAVPELRKGGRPLCRWCLDWSERRPHLAGAIGARLASRSLEAGWVRRLDGSRAVQVTPKGEKALAEMLGLDLRAAGYAPELTWDTEQPWII